MRIIVKSTTRDGKRFGGRHPINGWATRVAQVTGTWDPVKGFRANKHVKVSCLLKIDKRIEEEDPINFNYIMRFIEMHNLDYEEIDDEPKAD